MDPAQDVSGLSPTVHLGKGPSHLTGAMFKKLDKSNFLDIHKLNKINFWNLFPSERLPVRR